MYGCLASLKPIGVHPKYIIHTITNSLVQQTINYVGTLQKNMQLQ